MEVESIHENQIKEEKSIQNAHNFY